ncbi:MAG: T9SS type A sorting domain-containing protein [Ignavibacteriales bacterium]|nr:T9SS type A sorting domain-containing protein [Ignavibacteriales bacterium]
MIVLHLALAGSLAAQALPIYLDGRFADWPETVPTYVDSDGDGNSYDFKSFSVANDEKFLFIRFLITPEFKLLENNNITLYIDGDHNASTGFPINGIGAELQWNFGSRTGTFHGQSTASINHASIRLRVLPSVTATEYELAIGRDVHPDGSSLLFSADSIRVLFTDETTNGDTMPNQGETFTYVFDNSPVPALEPVSLHRSSESHLRVMSYNVYNDGLTSSERTDAYSRILNAIQPDVICFNEMWTSSATQVRDVLNAMLPLGAGARWYTVKLDPGNITASRYPINQSWLVYGSTNRITAALIEVPQEFGGDVLVVNAHFRCCTADIERQQEADAVVAFFLEAQSSGGRITLPQNTPFLLVGDLNLVGFSQQLRTLLTGEIVNTGTFGQGAPPDWDQTPLEDVISQQTDKRMAYTWRNDASSFSPGRLDFVIHSNSVLNLEKSFILQTEVMPSERLQLYGLQSSDTHTASDHLPHVADFSLRTVVSVPPVHQENPTGYYLSQNYPNPFNPTTTIQFNIPDREFVFLTVHNALGERVAVLVNEIRSPGTHTVSIATSGLPSGVYFYSLQAGKFAETKKLMLLH